MSTVTDAACNSHSDCDWEVSNIDAYYCAYTIGGDDNLECGYNTKLDAVYCNANKWQTWQE